MSYPLITFWPFFDIKWRSQSFQSRPWHSTTTYISPIPMRQLWSTIIFQTSIHLHAAFIRSIRITIQVNPYTHLHSTISHSNFRNKQYLWSSSLYLQWRKKWIFCRMLFHSQSITLYLLLSLDIPLYYYHSKSIMTCYVFLLNRLLLLNSFKLRNYGIIGYIHRHHGSSSSFKMYLLYVESYVRKETDGQTSVRSVIHKFAFFPHFLCSKFHTEYYFTIYMTW